MHPDLRVFSETFDVIETRRISDEDGMGHVHPTMVIAGSRLLYAWSKGETSDTGVRVPSVQVEEFALSWP